jgi:hypothetical protein
MFAFRGAAPGKYAWSTSRRMVVQLAAECEEGRAQICPTTPLVVPSISNSISDGEETTMISIDNALQ